MSRIFTSAMTAALTTLFLIPPLTGWAAPEDYRFELAGQPEKTDAGMLVKLRLVTMAGGKPVPGVEIVQTRLDMGPDGMPTMTAKVRSLPANEPDIYLFEAQPTMAGNWALSVSAKIQGEPEPVTGAITILVAK